MNQERLLKVLLGLYTSEKSTNIADRHRQFAFKVASDATKIEVKHAIEQLFSVNVEGVRIVNVRGKTRRFAQILGQKKSWKKAYVSLREGQDINLMATE